MKPELKFALVGRGRIAKRHSELLGNEPDGAGGLLWKAGGVRLPVKWFRQGFAEPVMTRDGVTLYSFKKDQKLPGPTKVTMRQSRND